MATMKSYTDISQSKKLAEILSIESADMKWFFWMEESNASKSPSFGYSKTTAETYKYTDAVYLPCWSLSALFSILPAGSDVVKEQSDDKDGEYMCTVGYKNDVLSTFSDNPVDVCVAMIEKLHELKML